MWELFASAWSSQPHLTKTGSTSPAGNLVYADKTSGVNNGLSHKARGS